MIKKLIYLFLKDNNKIIFIDSKKSYTCKEFKEKIFFFKNQFTAIWSKNNTNKGVAILLDRNVNYFAVIFAVWLSNGYYLPLSKKNTKKNNNYQIKKSGISIVVTDIEKNIVVKKRKTLRHKKFLNLSYIIFTSGSTGKKKGVMISNKSFISYLKNIKNNVNNIKPKSILINGEITFDIVNADIVFALINKSRICITENPKNLFSLISLLKASKSDSLYCVPTTWENIIYFSKSLNQKYNFLKYAISGGEQLSKKTYDNIKKIAPNAKIFNFYGPTEFTINVSFAELNIKNINKNELIDNNNNFAIGRIFPSIKYKILNKNKSNEGELFLSGKQMMSGYVNSKKNNFYKINNKYYYNTGDIVKKNIHNVLFFIGRKKDYIKYKGYRINLQNISNHIKKNLKKNCVIKIINNNIIAYFEKTKKLSKLEINKITNQLEEYEKPNKIVYLKKFPLLSNGKIDHNKIGKNFE